MLYSKEVFKEISERYAFFLFAAVFSQLSKFITDCLPHPTLMQGLDFEQVNEIVPAHGALNMT